MSKIFNLSEFEGSVTELISKQEGLSTQFVNDAQNRKTRIVNNVSILRKEIIPSPGMQHLIDEDTKKVVGISDFTENVLPDSEVLIINAIRVGFATDDASGKAAILAYNEVLPPSFRNAVLRLRLEGEVKFTSSLSELFNVNRKEVTLEDDFIKLAVPVALTGGSDIKFELEFPKGATPTASKKEYLELAFKGLKATR
ncbi:hypothetical protein [Tenacibaculum aiptasiae]|uniref:hypothetical protein n=1 Tax=Tenacibaculum aiptasiae TaxID=426481 RepID=UPI00232B667C|nr:hypothetical protein [Tenacibaculum aiptasiae]